MPSIKAEFAAPTTADGEKIDIAPQAGESDPRAFAPIEPGFYPAIVHELKSKTYNASWKEFKNPDSPDGKWVYLAVTPSLEILNASTNGVNSRITRQDETLGVLFRGKMYRPDGTQDSPFFKSGQNLLAAVSMFSTNGAVASIDGDTDWIVKRPIKVRVGRAGYVSGRGVNLTPFELATAFTRLNGDNAEFTSEDVPELIEQYNFEQGYIDQNGEQIEFVYVDKNGAELAEPIAVRLRLKNYAVGYYFPDNQMIRKHEWYVRNGKVFLTEAYANSYERIVEAHSNARSEDF